VGGGENLRRIHRKVKKKWKKILNTVKKGEPKRFGKKKNYRKDARPEKTQRQKYRTEHIRLSDRNPLPGSSNSGRRRI